MSNPQFGSGVLFGIPNGGALLTNPTPQMFGILQEVNVDIKGAIKKLRGQQQVALDIARGNIDVSVKGKIASHSPAFYAQVYFGQPTATGMNRPVVNEKTVAASTVTPVKASASSDLGVINGLTGGQMERITGSGAPVTGQYKFLPATTGGSPTDAEYIFSTADATASLPVLLNYVWPDTTGTTLTVTNQPGGTAPEIQATLYNKFRNRVFGMLLYRCVLGNLSIPTKQEDYWVSDFDMEAAADISGNVLDIFSDYL